MSAVSSRRSPAHPRNSSTTVPKRRRRHHSHRSGIWWLPLTIRLSLWLGVIALVAVVITLLMNAGFDDPNPQSKTIQLTDQDVDPETTNLGKTHLHENQVDQRLAFYLWAEAQRRLPADTLTEVRNSLTHGAVTLAIGPLVKEMSDDLEGMILAKTGRDESIEVLIIKAPTLFDHRSCQPRQRGEFAVPGQTTLTNGLYICWIDPFLERQSRMERDCPGARVGDRVGEQNDLDLRFREAAAMHIAEQTYEAVDQNRGRRHCSGNVRDHAE